MSLKKKVNKSASRTKKGIGSKAKKAKKRF